MADSIGAADAALAAKKAQDSELVALKQQVDRLRGDLTPGVSGKQKMRKACNDFEAVFISKMWEQMRATIPKDGYLNSPQQEMYRSMFDRDFAEKLASDGGIGLGNMLYSQLKDKIKDGGGGKTGTANGSAAAHAAPPMPESTQPPMTPTTEVSAKTGLKMPKRSQAAVPDQSANTQAGTHVRAAGPAQPTSVPGEVMADVEALAKRIEADFDRRQAVNGYGQNAAAVGSKIATVG